MSETMAAAERRGYDRAVARLGDGRAFTAWRASGEPQSYYCTSTRDAEICAEFLAADQPTPTPEGNQT